MSQYQIACNWSFSSVAADRFSMKSQTTCISSFAPDSKPCESWKIKLLPSYVIWCSISCKALWWPNAIREHMYIVNHWFTSTDGIKWVSEGSSCLPRRNGIWDTGAWDFIQLTHLVIYDRFYSLFNTTNLLKDGCLASIGSSYDENAKMGTFVSFPEHFYILHLCNCKESVRVIFIFWRRNNILAHQMQLHQWSLPSQFFYWEEMACIIEI